MSRERARGVTYMKFSKTVGNSWHNVLDQLQPGIPGETVQGRHDGREELHTTGTAAKTGIYLFYWPRLVIFRRLLFIVLLWCDAVA